MMFLNTKFMKCFKFVLIVYLMLSVEVASLNSNIDQLLKPRRAKYMPKECEDCSLDKLEEIKNIMTEWEEKNNKIINDFMRFKSLQANPNSKEQLQFEFKANTEILMSFTDDELGNHIVPRYAHAGSYARTGYWFWNQREYPATNAIPGRNWSNGSWLDGITRGFGLSNWRWDYTYYWLSNDNVGQDWWEGFFSGDDVVDVMYIDWLHPPKKFSVSFTRGNEEIMLKDRDDLPMPESSKTGTGSPLLEPSENNTLIFHKQLKPTKIKIMMFEHHRINRFGIRCVSFYRLRPIVMVRNQSISKSREYCMFVNTDLPRHNFGIEVHDCVDSVAVGNNYELFIHDNDETLKVFNKYWDYEQQINRWYCVGWNTANELAVWNCNNLAGFAQINRDVNSITRFDKIKDECWYYDTANRMSKNYISAETLIRVTTQMDDQTFKVDNFREVGETFWQSVVGQLKATIQIHFGKVDDRRYENKKIDEIAINWVHPALNFRVLTWRPNNGWTVRGSFTGNTQKSTILSLKGIECAAVMIVMDLTKKIPEFNNEFVYSIKEVIIRSESFMSKKGDCKNVKAETKKLEFNKQYRRTIPQTSPFRNAVADLSKKWDSCISIYYKIKLTRQYIDKAKTKSLELYQILLTIENKIGKRHITNMQSYEREELTNLKSDVFYDYLVKFRNLDTKALLNFTNNEEPAGPGKGSLDIKGLLGDGPDNKDQKGGKNSDSLGGSGNTGKANASSFKLGTKEAPAKDCLDLRQKYPVSTSGFYFIKPDCSDDVLRVFCDFSIFGSAVDIYLFNDDIEDGTPNLNYLNINEVNSVKYQCAKKGLFPIFIQNGRMVQRIYDLLKLRRYDLAKNVVVPLGYDYGCNSRKCSAKYRSLTDQNSQILNGFFPGGGRKKGMLLNPDINQYPWAGLNNSKRLKMATFDMKTSVVAGLICSTNHFKKTNKDDQTVNADCDYNILQDGSKFRPGGGVIIVKCPAKCKGNPENVIGSGTYHGASPLCKSAIHAGLIDEEGGFFRVKTIASNNNNFKNEEKNGISSVSSVRPEQRQQYSFTLMKYRLKCPIDYVPLPQEERDQLKSQEKTSSFIEEDMEISEKDMLEMNFISKIANSKILLNKLPSNKIPRFSQKTESESLKRGFMNKLKQGANNIANKAKNAGQNLANTASNALTNTMNQGINNLQNSTTGQAMDAASNLLGNALGNVAQDVANVNNLSGAKDAAQDLANSNPQNEADKIQQEMANMADNSLDSGPDTSNQPKIQPTKTRNEEKMEEMNAPSTENAIKKLKDIRKTDEHYLRDINTKIGRINIVFEKFSKLISWAKSVYYYRMIRFKIRISLLMRMFEIRARTRITITIRIVNAWKMMLLRSMRTSPWKVDYSMPFEQQKNFLFATNDFESVNGVQADWGYVTKGTKNRPQVIGNLAPVKSDKHLAASFFFANGRRFYNFNLTVDILIQTAGGPCGIVWKFKDSFNYYAFVINKKKGTKGIYKVYYGKPTLIKQFKDGGMNINTWYSVKISASGSQYKIAMRSLESTNAGNFLYNFTDFTHVSGSVGVFVNDVQGFLFDKLMSAPTNCSTDFVPKPDLEIITSCANNWQETFKGNVLDNYKEVDPEFKVIGSAWQSGVGGKTATPSINQTSLVNDLSELQRPAMLVKKSKYIKEGTVDMCFTPSQENGTISLIFKYLKENQNGRVSEKFYSFDATNVTEASGKVNGAFTLRKYNDGKMRLLRSITNPGEIQPKPPGSAFQIGYRVRANLCMRIQIVKNTIKAYTSLNNDSYIQIMEVEDNPQIDIGLIGFGTSKATMMVTSFRSICGVKMLTSPEVARIMNADTIDIPFSGQDKFPDAHIINADYFANGGATSSGFGASLSKYSGDGANSSANSSSASLGFAGYSDGVNNYESGKKVREKERDNEVLSNCESGKGAVANPDLGIGWTECFINKTREQREAYCTNTLKVADELKNKCVRNYCGECCDTNTKDPKDRHVCVKACEKAKEDSDNIDAIIDQCVNSSSQNSIYAFISKQYESNKGMRMLDMIAACNLCCSSSNLWSEETFSIPAVHKCMEACNEKLRIPKPVKLEHAMNRGA